MGVGLRLGRWGRKEVKRLKGKSYEQLFANKKGKGHISIPLQPSEALSLLKCCNADNFACKIASHNGQTGDPIGKQGCENALF